MVKGHLKEVADVRWHGQVSLVLSVHAGRIKQVRLEYGRIMRPGD